MENRKLTICFLGSAESIHMLKWVKYFSVKGHDVHLISYASLLKNYDLGDIKFYFIKKIFPTKIWPFNTLLNLPLTLITVKKLIEKIKPNIVHAHYATSYGSIGALLGFHPFIITAWGSDILLTPQKFPPSKWAIRYNLKKADLITCDAEHMREAMVILGADSRKIKIINFGVDTQKFSPGGKSEWLQKKLGIFNSPTIISLRVLEPVYDVRTLIKAAPLIIKEISQVKFIIAGDGSEKEKLKNLAKSLEISESIRFVGWISSEELPLYLRAADVYVSTSLSDAGLSSSTAEAMARGLPVVITDFGDNKEWVKDKENGFLVPLKNPEILAEKIIYLLKNKEIGKKFGERNRKIIEERNNYYKEMAKMEEIYKKLM